MDCVHRLLPLGGIVVKREHPVELQQRIDRVLRRSIEYAFAHPEEALPYVRSLAQEMDTAVMQQHIGLYVNDYSIDLGAKGRAAVQFLFDTAVARGIIAPVQIPIFVPSST